MPNKKHDGRYNRNAFLEEIICYDSLGYLDLRWALGGMSGGTADVC